MYNSNTIEKTEYVSNTVAYECRQLINSVVFDIYFSAELIQHYYDSISTNKQIDLHSFKFNDEYKFIEFIYNDTDFFYINEFLYTVFESFCKRLVTDETYFIKLMNINCNRALLLKDVVYNRPEILRYISFNVLHLGSWLTRITLV